MMRRVALLTVALLLCTAQASPPGLPPGVFTGRGALDGAGGAPPAYSGPGDVVSSALMWWGLRAYSAATKGNVAINVCNVADVACADLSTDATSGALTISTIGGSSCAIVSCTIKTLYDQTGNGYDLTQATIANRPVLTINCIGSLPCMTGNGTSTAIANTTNLGGVTPITHSVVAERTGNTSADNTIISSNGGLIQGLFDNTADNVEIYQGGTLPTAPATDNAFHALQYVYNSASSVISVDGSATNVDTGVSNVAATNQSMFSVTAANFCACKITEAGLWGSAFDGTQQSNMSSNQHSYWGF